MKRSSLLIFLLLSLAARLLGQPAREASAPVPLEELGLTIQAELETHGDRVLGQETYRWSTRLVKLSGCRAELSMRVTSNLGENTVRTESVNFSLGALEPYNIDRKKSWLELPCANHEKCVFSTSTCSRKTRSGVVTDCATASQNRVESFSLQFDGDATAGSRLERDFRQAINLCREPKTVNF